MTDEDKQTIERYARAYYANPRMEEMRQAAIAAYRRCLKEPCEKSLHMKFMSEVDNEVPDYSLRAFYRQQLLRDFTP